MSAADEIYNWLITPIEERMMRVVTRLVRDPDEAADAFQNALAQVWRDLDRIRRHPNPRAYILRVCVSTAYDALRRRSRRRCREAPLEDEAAFLLSESNPAQSAMRREMTEEVLAAIAALPPHQAQALLLRVLEEQPFDAIAQALGCGEATARSHVSKARERLRQLLNRPAPAGRLKDEPEHSPSLG